MRGSNNTWENRCKDNLFSQALLGTTGFVSTPGQTAARLDHLYNYIVSCLHLLTTIDDIQPWWHACLNETHHARKDHLQQPNLRSRPDRTADLCTCTRARRTIQREVL